MQHGTGALLCMADRFSAFDRENLILPIWMIFRLEKKMKEILTITQKIERYYDYYRAQLNAGSPVFVSQVDVNQMLTSIDQLSKKVLIVSPSISTELVDIKQHLFIMQGPGLCSFNISRFGALGVVLRYLQSEDFACDTARFIRTPWQDVNDALKKLLIDANSVNTRIDYNQVGVAAREIFILLAQKVYTPEVKMAAGKHISSSDAKGMLEAFFDYKSIDEDVKKYAKETIKLAEPLTHTKSENVEKMKTLIMAVICLAGIVNNVFQL